LGIGYLYVGTEVEKLLKDDVTVCRYSGRIIAQGWVTCV
jgi:hypothetical protein